MQIMGDVRGYQAAAWALIDESVSEAASVLGASSDEILTPAEHRRVNETIPIGAQNFPLKNRPGGVNFRNEYQEGNDDLQLQFAYRATDCRLYYTFENLIELVSTWVAAARAIWGDGQCVVGKGAATGTVGSLGVVLVRIMRLLLRRHL